MNIIRNLASLALAVSSIGAHAGTPLAASTTAPVTFGFEGLTVPFYTAVPIPDGYADAIWTGWVLRRRDELQYTELNGGSGVVMAVSAADAPQIAFASPVLFDGVFAFNPRSSLGYDLFLGAQRVGGSGTRPAGGGYLASQYGGLVDRVVFNGSGYGFSIDDMAVTPMSPVPEPAAWALLLGGVTALCLRRRADRRC